MARKVWKAAVSDVIIRLQAFKYNQQILRTTEHVKENLTDCAPHLTYLDKDDVTIYGESYYSEGEEGDYALGEDIEIKEYGEETGVDSKLNQLGIQGAKLDINRSIDSEEEKRLAELDVDPNSEEAKKQFADLDAFSDPNRATPEK